MEEEDLETSITDYNPENSTEDVDVTELSKSDSLDVSITSKEKPHKLLHLPLARIKTIMKLDPDCTMISQDSIFLTAKATELFIEYLVKESSKHLGQGRRKTVSRRDVDAAVENLANLCFLDGILE